MCARACACTFLDFGGFERRERLGDGVDRDKNMGSLGMEKYHDQIHKKFLNKLTKENINKLICI